MKHRTTHEVSGLKKKFGFVCFLKLNPALNSHTVSTVMDKQME